MKVEFKTIVELTDIEAQSIKEVRDTLCAYNMHSYMEQDEALDNLFQEKMGEYDSNYMALPMTINFLTFLLRISGHENEKD
jgi:hypothetical protein